MDEILYSIEGPNQLNEAATSNVRWVDDSTVGFRRWVASWDCYV